MSGGDLDGDPYWICHDERLLFNKNENPLDYLDQTIKDTRQIQSTENSNYTINDVCDFFIEYIKADK